MYVQHNTLARWRYHNRRGNATIRFVLLTLSHSNGTIFGTKTNIEQKMRVLIFFTTFA
jgi:hypothetical protein